LVQHFFPQVADEVDGRVVPLVRGLRMALHFEVGHLSRRLRASVALLQGLDVGLHCCEVFF
jgi:hypothetical protein